MENLKTRFERIRSTISTHLNETDPPSFPASLRGDGVTRNNNYHRRALYSELELFKMELEEFIFVDESSQAEGKDEDDTKTIDRKEGSGKTSSNTVGNRTDVTSPLMASRIDALTSNNSYVDGNRSNIISYNNTYNDIDNSSSDRDRLLADTSSTGATKNGSKYNIIAEDDEAKEGSENNPKNSPSKESYRKNDQPSVLKEGSYKKEISAHSDSDTSAVLQMIEECSSISAKFGLKFAQRDPHW